MRRGEGDELAIKYMRRGRDDSVLDSVHGYLPTTDKSSKWQPKEEDVDEPNNPQNKVLATYGLIFEGSWWRFDLVLDPSPSLCKICA